VVTWPQKKNGVIRSSKRRKGERPEKEKEGSERPADIFLFDPPHDREKEVHLQRGKRKRAIPTWHWKTGENYP